MGGAGGKPCHRRKLGQGAVGGGGVRRWLKVNGPVAEDIMVFGQAPRSAERSKRRNVSYLGLLPPARGGENDIAILYLTKLREWRKLKAARICIRTWAQDNGWESKGLVQISHVFVRRAR